MTSGGEGRAMAFAKPDLISCMTYPDAPAAIDWLERAFGFTRHVVYPNSDGTIAHAEMCFGNGIVMLGSDGKDGGFPMTSPTGGGPVHQSVYVIVTDPDVHYARAKAAGAEIVRELKDEDYGSRGYSCRDPGGHVWTFGTYRPKQEAAAPIASEGDDR